MRISDWSSDVCASDLDDRQGHGTPMAGLATFGDLTELLASPDPVVLTHRIESVKLINPADPHEKDLSGAVTRESAYRVEVTSDRSSVYCLEIGRASCREKGCQYVRFSVVAETL